MKATLLKITSRVIDIPEDKGIYREMIREPIQARALYEGDAPDGPEVTSQVINYRPIWLAGYDGQGDFNGRYLVNDEMFQVAAPILKDIIEFNTKVLTDKNNELFAQILREQSAIRMYRRSWWERLKRRLGVAR